MGLEADLLEIAKREQQELNAEVRYGSISRREFYWRFQGFDVIFYWDAMREFKGDLTYKLYPGD